MSTSTEFDDAPVPTDEQMLDIIRDGLWSCDARIHPDVAYCIPGERFLPSLRAALDLTLGTLRDAVAGLPKDCQRALKLTGTQTASPKWELRAQYPEIARVCKLEIAAFALEYVIADLEQEGRPTVLPKIAKIRRVG